MTTPAGDQTTAERDHDFVHRLRVRYGECDMQGVVFNPNYLVYVDDTMDVWLEAMLGRGYLERFDFVVKKATVEWTSAARAGEMIDLRPAVTRWGRTSFDVTVTLHASDRLVAEALLVLVSVTPGTATPAPIPDEIHEALTARQ